MTFNLAAELADARSEARALRHLHRTHGHYVRVAPRIRWDDLEPVELLADDCGTVPAYKRHRANGEDCAECRAANTAHARQHRARRKERAA